MSLVSVTSWSRIYTRHLSNTWHTFFLPPFIVNTVYFDHLCYPPSSLVKFLPFCLATRMATNYNAIGGNQASPYGSGDPYYNESSGYITPHPTKKRTSNWIKIGVPVLILVIIGAVVGGVLGSRSKSKSDSSNGPGGISSGDAAATSAASAKLEIGRFATATDSDFMMPVYPSTVRRSL